MKKFAAVLLMTLFTGTMVLGQTLFESFEAAWTNGGTTPAGWTRTQVSGSGEWGQKFYPLTGQQPPFSNLPYSGRAVAWFSTNQPAGTRTRLESPSMDFSTLVNPYMKLSFVNRTGSDSLRVLYSTDAGANWTQLARYGRALTTSWQVKYISLASLAGQSDVKVGLEAVVPALGDTSDIWVDHLLISGREVTIRQIQEVPLDWLLLSDTLQSTQQARWLLQASPFMGDTVTVTALVITPCASATCGFNGLTFTQHGWTMLLHDTAANSNEWGGILVRVGSASDTAQAILDGFTAPGRGDIIRMTGKVEEFPPGVMNSTTQFRPIPSIAISIVGSGTIPPPTILSVPDFYAGAFSGGKVTYSIGEQYEGSLVELTNLTVNAVVNIGRGTWQMTDANGNYITDYDASHFFTYGNEFPTIPGDPSFEAPPPGAVVNTIRGTILTVTGAESPRGYRISPIYPGDLTVGLVLPLVTSALRSPAVVSSSDSVQLSVRVYQQSAQYGYPIASVKLFYSVDNSLFVEDSLTYTLSDSTARGVIPPQPENSFVRYFIQAFDTLNNSTTLASFASSGGDDTSKGFFFYTVLNRPLTIRDIQYTPFANGYSPYASDLFSTGALVSVSGIVTADTSDIDHFNAPRPGGTGIGGTFGWYMQSTNLPWSGIWLTGPDSVMISLRRGDSVTVRGRVQEVTSFNQRVTTRISGIDSVFVHSHSNPVPASVEKTTGTFGPAAANGDPNAEPYEGMLVRFTNVAVTDTNPYFANATIYEISDGSGGVWVHRDGTNRYTNQAGDVTDESWHLLQLGDQFTSITGIIHFSANRYKFVPRSNADFMPVTGVTTRDNGLPTAFDLRQNYPNPFNPSTVIEYDIPKASFVTLKIYNILGQEVVTLVNEEQMPGRYVTRFNGTSVASGVYFYRLTAGNFVTTKKMLFLK